ncbi:MAG TPA: hypothetical protein VFX15_13160 [Actinomycetes bacterium]|nr:hypothetical protein [Actinomycetes bacterium]
MFLQMIEGKVRDADLLNRQMEAWRTDVKPGAIGFLGATGGMTDDGRSVTVARFESQDAAMQNAHRPEQDAWWRATAPAFDGEPTFIDCPEVDLIMGGGSDGAGFVQIMKGRTTDKQKLREMGDQMEEDMPKMRPDVVGGVVGWHGDRDFIQVIYFSSEEEARKAEAAQASGEAEGPPDDWSALIDGEITFIDLHEPQFD